MTTDPGACESTAEPGTEAEELFLAAVEAAADGEFPDVDQLVADHPALATELREIDASYRRACAVLGTPEVSADDLPEVAPRYQVRREIASGGMGTVLEVWDTELRRLLAMKSVRSRGRGGRPDDWGSRQRRLRNEARMLGQLVHPGILPLHDVGETATGDVWFTMQLVAGDHLGTLIDRCHDGDPEWTTPRLLGVVLRVCEAMAYAHSRGVLHRDLKPDNVMVGPFGETYVLDWGLARLLGEEGGDVALGAAPRVDVGTLGADSGAVAVGTPSYMPPEQAGSRAGQVDVRADVYAVGSILYHLLAGCRPYSELASSPLRVLEAVRAGPPASLIAGCRRLPAELIAVTERAMARDAGARYQSMQDLADDLRAFLEGRVVRAHRTGALIELRKWVQRNRGVAMAIAVVALGLVAALIWQAGTNHELRRRDYRSKVALAAHAAERADVRVVRELLAGCAPAMRGWEWHAIRRLSDASEVVLAEHDRAVQCVTASAGGTRLLTGARDGRLCLWDPDEVRLLRAWQFDDFVGSAVFCGEDRALVSVGATVLDLAFDRDEPLRSVTIDEPNLHVILALSADGRRLLVGGAIGRVELWDAEVLERREVWLDGLYGVSQMQWCDGDRFVLVAGRDREQDDERHSVVRVLDGQSGEQVLALPGHRNWVSSAQMNEAGDRIASGGWDGRVLVWSFPEGELLRELPRAWSGEVRVAWQKTDLLVGARPTLELWNVASSAAPLVLAGHSDPITDLAALPDGRVVSGSNDTTVRIWPIDGRPIASELECTSAGRGLSRRRGTTELAVAGEAGSVEVWDVARRERIRTSTVPCRRTRIAHTASGDRIVTGDVTGMVMLLDADSLAEQRAVQGHRTSIVGLATHPTDDAVCVTTCVDATVRSWDLDLMLPLWEVQAGDPEVWPNGAHECVFAPDGRSIAVGANDGRLRVLATEDGAVLREYRCDSEAHTYGSPCYSPDGSRLYARVWNDRICDLVAWRVASGEVLWTRTGGRQAFAECSVTPDGSRVLTSNDNGDPVVFDALDGAGFATLSAGVARQVVAQRLVDGVLVQSTVGRLRFWDGRATEER